MRAYLMEILLVCAHTKLRLSESGEETRNLHFAGRISKALHRRIRITWTSLHQTAKLTRICVNVIL